MIRVDGYKNLYRDDSGAIVSIDTDEYSQYVKLKSQRKQQRDELVEMRKDIEEIKSLLKEFLNGSKQN